MSQKIGPRLDEISYWSEIKLEIIGKYAAAYSRILSNPAYHYLHHSYIDGFAGPGHARSKAKDTFLPGSPRVPRRAGGRGRHARNGLTYSSITLRAAAASWP